MNESIMKTDRRGRLRYTPEQKKTMVDAYRARLPQAEVDVGAYGGMSAVAKPYARRFGPRIL